jgi:hypothetical protein
VKRALAYGLTFSRRVWLAGVVTCACAFVALQFEGIVAKNLAVSHELAQARSDVRALQERQKEQFLTIKRLGTPAGAIPEIHDKLRYVGPHEELIYVRGLPSPTPEPDEGWEAPP